MRHVNLMKMLTDAGATVTTQMMVPENVGRITPVYTAALNGHRLVWFVNFATGWAIDMQYYVNGEDSTHLLIGPPLLSQRTSNGTLAKRFIERAACRRWTVDGIEIEYGPDATLLLRPSLRVTYPPRNVGECEIGSFARKCTVSTPAALAMGASTADGVCPPEALLDWLKDNNHLED